MSSKFLFSTTLLVLLLLVVVVLVVVVLPPFSIQAAPGDIVFSTTAPGSSTFLGLLDEDPVNAFQTTAVYKSAGVVGVDRFTGKELWRIAGSFIVCALDNKHKTVWCSTYKGRSLLCFSLSISSHDQLRRHGISGYADVTKIVLDDRNDVIWSLDENGYIRGHSLKPSDSYKQVYITTSKTTNYPRSFEVDSPTQPVGAYQYAAICHHSGGRTLSNLFMFSLVNGTKLYSVSTRALGIDSTFRPDCGHRPVFDSKRGLVFFSVRMRSDSAKKTPNFIFALESRSGKQIWNMSGNTFAFIGLLPSDNDILLVGVTSSSSNGCVARTLDPLTGNQIGQSSSSLSNKPCSAFVLRDLGDGKNVRMYAKSQTGTTISIDVTKDGKTFSSPPPLAAFKNVPSALFSSFNKFNNRDDDGIMYMSSTSAKFVAVRTDGFVSLPSPASPREIQQRYSRLNFTGAVIKFAQFKYSYGFTSFGGRFFFAAPADLSSGNKIIRVDMLTQARSEASTISSAIGPIRAALRLNATSLDPNTRPPRGFFVSENTIQEIGNISDDANSQNQLSVTKEHNTILNCPAPTSAASIISNEISGNHLFLATRASMLPAAKVNGVFMCKFSLNASQTFFKFLEKVELPSMDHVTAMIPLHHGDAGAPAGILIVADASGKLYQVNSDLVLVPFNTSVDPALERITVLIRFSRYIFFAAGKDSDCRIYRFRTTATTITAASSVAPRSPLSQCSTDDGGGGGGSTTTGEFKPTFAVIDGFNSSASTEASQLYEQILLAREVDKVGSVFRFDPKRFIFMENNTLLDGSVTGGATIRSLQKYQSVFIASSSAASSNSYYASSGKVPVFVASGDTSISTGNFLKFDLQLPPPPPDSQTTTSTGGPSTTSTAAISTTLVTTTTVASTSASSSSSMSTTTGFSTSLTGNSTKENDNLTATNSSSVISSSPTTTVITTNPSSCSSINCTTSSNESSLENGTTTIIISTTPSTTSSAATGNNTSNFSFHHVSRTITFANASDNNNNTNATSAPPLLLVKPASRLELPGTSVPQVRDSAAIVSLATASPSGAVSLMRTSHIARTASCGGGGGGGGESDDSSSSSSSASTSVSAGRGKGLPDAEESVAASPFQLSWGDDKLAKRRGLLIGNTIFFAAFLLVHGIVVICCSQFSRRKGKQGKPTLLESAQQMRFPSLVAIPITILAPECVSAATTLLVFSPMEIADIVSIFVFGFFLSIGVPLVWFCFITYKAKSETIEAPPQDEEEEEKKDRKEEEDEKSKKNKKEKKKDRKSAKRKKGDDSEKEEEEDDSDGEDEDEDDDEELRGKCLMLRPLTLVWEFLNRAVLEWIVTDQILRNGLVFDGFNVWWYGLFELIVSCLIAISDGLTYSENVSDNTCLIAASIQLSVMFFYAISIVVYRPHLCLFDRIVNWSNCGLALILSCIVLARLTTQNTSLDDGLNALSYIIMIVGLVGCLQMINVFNTIEDALHRLCVGERKRKKGRGGKKSRIRRRREIVVVVVSNETPSSDINNNNNNNTAKTNLKARSAASSPSQQQEMMMVMDQELDERPLLHQQEQQNYQNQQNNQHYQKDHHHHQNQQQQQQNRKIDHHHSKAKQQNSSPTRSTSGFSSSVSSSSHLPPPSPAARAAAAQRRQEIFSSPPSVSTFSPALSSMFTQASSTRLEDRKQFTAADFARFYSSSHPEEVKLEMEKGEQQEQSQPQQNQQQATTHQPGRRRGKVSGRPNNNSSTTKKKIAIDTSAI